VVGGDREVVHVVEADKGPDADHGFEGVVGGAKAVAGLELSGVSPGIAGLVPEKMVLSSVDDGEPTVGVANRDVSKVDIMIKV
jgi:hypothetical protein